MINQERVQMIVAKVLQSERLANAPSPMVPPVGELLRHVELSMQVYQSFSLKKQLTILDEMRVLWQSNCAQLIDASCTIQHGERTDKIRLFNHILENTLDIKAITSTSVTGDHGLTLIDYSAYGIFLVALPKKQAIETMISHIIPLLSAGNAVIFLADRDQISAINRVLALIFELLDTHKINSLINLYELNEGLWSDLLNHPKISAVISSHANLLTNQHALMNKKSFISACAPVPVIVDETADLKSAAAHIIQGTKFDHNLLYCAEKFVIVVEEAFDYFAHCLDIEGGDWAPIFQTRFLASDFKPEAYYGQSLSTISQALKLPQTEKTVALIPLLEDALNLQSYHQYSGLPLLFVIKARDIKHAVSIAQKIDHNAHFMAIIHSKNIDHLSLCARAMQTSVFVKNAPSYAALGMEGEGFPSLFIANVTGEGPLHPQDYARKRRCVLAEGFLIR